MSGGTKNFIFFIFTRAYRTGSKFNTILNLKKYWTAHRTFFIKFQDCYVFTFVNTMMPRLNRRSEDFVSFITTCNSTQSWRETKREFDARTGFVRVACQSLIWAHPYRVNHYPFLWTHAAQWEGKRGVSHIPVATAAVLAMKLTVQKIAPSISIHTDFHRIQTNRDH